MSRHRNDPERRGGFGRSRRDRAIIAGIALLLPGIIAAFRGPELRWTLANLAILGFPAAALVVLIREGMRIGIALCLGFRLFGVHWGVGPQLFHARLNGIYFRFSPIPLGADARLASSQPNHHRLARFCSNIAPIIGQTIGVVVTAHFDVLETGGVASGFAPLTVLHLANVLLLGIHGFVPFETQSGVRSDQRRLIDLLFSGPAEDRASRAVALSMGVESRLARGSAREARKALDSSIAQLGREPMLVALEERLVRIERAPNTSAAAVASALPDPFARPWEPCLRLAKNLPLRRRAIQTASRFVPVAVLVVFFFVHEYDTLIRSAHGRWTEEALAIAIGRDAEDCGAHLSTYSNRLSRLSLVAPISRDLQVHELRTRAALHACTRDFERAIRDQSLAVQIADASRRQAAINAAPDAPDRVNSELAHSSELRQLSAWHAARGHYRDALRTVRRAEQELQGVIQQTSNGPASRQRRWALSMLEHGQEELESTRHRIIQGMDVRG